MEIKVTLTDVPPVIIFNIVHEKLLFDDEIRLEVQGIQRVRALRGIIYGGQGHFTCRIVKRDGAMWFHDRITTGSSCIPEVNVRSLTNRSVLQQCGENKVVAVEWTKIGCHITCLYKL
jgi:hypothetical protein